MRIILCVGVTLFPSLHYTLFPPPVYQIILSMGRMLITRDLSPLVTHSSMRGKEPFDQGHSLIARNTRLFVFDGCPYAASQLIYNSHITTLIFLSSVTPRTAGYHFSSAFSKSARVAWGDVRPCSTVTEHQMINIQSSTVAFFSNEVNILRTRPSIRALASFHVKRLKNAVL